MGFGKLMDSTATLKIYRQSFRFSETIENVWGILRFRMEAIAGWIEAIVQWFGIVYVEFHIVGWLFTWIVFIQRKSSKYIDSNESMISYFYHFQFDSGDFVLMPTSSTEL